ncbi:MAG: single-stranded-DNA-specific exonuclease RecJ, partial [Culicoidibacterales bacterium]
MRHGKHEYQLENMIQLNRDMIKQFEMLYLKQYNIDQDAIAPIAYEKWGTYFQFEQLEQWKALFTSDDIQEKSILIVGDYDVDGIMASKIALWICEQCGVEIVDVYIPNRFIDGYGLNKQIVQKAIDDEFDIILTVDNGVSAFEAIDYANEHGIDVLLTDHHHIKSSLPETKLILHPDKGTVNNGINICGAAVIFSLAYSLFKEESKHLVAYVMLATLADSMELHYLNRAFVKAGIDEMKSLDDPFIFQLIKQLEVDMNDAESLAWKLIPVLNAIGRMGDVNVFSEVLFWHSDDVEQAVNESIEINTFRKLETEKIVTDVIQTLNTDAIVCAKNEAWHQGVLGIAASRIVEMTQKPVILFSEKDGVNKGSGRSPEHFHLFDFLTLNSDNIHAFGGHAQA